MVSDLVSWPERVGVVGERARGDAPVGAGAVATEAIGCVEDDGGAEGACVELFVPVSSWKVSGQFEVAVMGNMRTHGW